MKVEFNEEDNTANEQAAEGVEKDSQLKEMLVDYVGEKHTPENEEVTVGMIVETLAEEFPEFLMVVAEENWIRGYHQAMHDVTEGERLSKLETQESE